MSEQMASYSNNPALVPEAPVCSGEGNFSETGGSSLASNAPVAEAQAKSAGSESTQNSKRKLNVYFMDPDGTAISNLSFRVDTPDACISGVSDMDGIGRVDVKEKAFFSLDVVRDDGSAETIYHGLMPPADANITAIAKSVRFSITTEPHEGTGATSAGGASSSGSKREVKSTRNSNGHPVAVVQPRQKDQTMADIIDQGVKISFESSGNPSITSTYWLYRLAKWTKSGPKKEIEIPLPTKDDGKGIEVKMAESDQKKFETLMDFSMKQVKWKYTSAGTDGAFNDYMNAKWNPADHPKDASKSLGVCYVYVKIALKIAGITSKTLTPTSMARKAPEEFLRPEKFTDVTKQCFSDPYVALPGDVIVYKKIKLTDKDKKKYKKPEDHPGHIEIRTYDGFVSDYFSHTPVSYFSGGYGVTGLYRKIYDEKAQKRQDAFLKVLRILETTTEDYYILNAPINGSKHFTDTSQHPWLDRTEKPSGTRAAGAYQIMLKKYNEIRMTHYYNHGKLFDPIAQTHMAIRILESRHQRNNMPSPSALSLIRQGKIEDAINTTKLYNEWSCLPGGVEPQIKSMSEFIELWREYLK